MIDVRDVYGDREERSMFVVTRRETERGTIDVRRDAQRDIERNDRCA
jgi:hypothetical protein